MVITLRFLVYFCGRLGFVILNSCLCFFCFCFRGIVVISACVECLVVWFWALIVSLHFGVTACLGFIGLLLFVIFGFGFSCMFSCLASRICILGFLLWFRCLVFVFGLLVD